MLSHVLGILRPYKRQVFVCFCLSIILYLITMISPLLIGTIIDGALGFGIIKWELFILAIGITAIALFLERISSSYLNRFANKLVKKQYMQSMETLLKKERLLYRKNSMGKIIDIFSKYLNIFEEYIVSLISLMLPSIIACIVLLGAVLYLSHGYVVLVIASFHGFVLCVSLWSVKRYESILAEYSSACYNLSDKWIELLGASRVVQAECSFDFSLKRLNESVENMVQRSVTKTEFTARMQSTTVFLQGSLLLALILILSFMVNQGRTTIGNVFSLIAINGMLQVHIARIGDFLILYKRALRYWSDFQSLEDFTTYFVEDKRDLRKFESLCIEPFTVKRDSHNIFSLQSNFTIYSGERIAVIGVSGSGKTTFLSLLFHPDLEHDDSIIINGKPQKSFNSSSIHQSVRISFQENDIFSGRGYESWFQSLVNPQRAERILKELGLPNDIVSGERYLEPYNESISGGEAKRLNIARLLVQPGDIHILDEPTTGLNESMTHRVWDCIFSHLEGTTILCATHDLQALYRFDRVVIIDQGAIVADIPPSEVPNNSYFKKIRDRL